MRMEKNSTKRVRVPLCIYLRVFMYMYVLSLKINVTCFKISRYVIYFFLLWGDVHWCIFFKASSYYGFHSSEFSGNWEDADNSATKKVNNMFHELMQGLCLCWITCQVKLLLVNMFTFRKCLKFLVSKNYMKIVQRTGSKMS